MYPFPGGYFEHKTNISFFLDHFLVMAYHHQDLVGLQPQFYCNLVKGSRPTRLTQVPPFFCSEGYPAQQKNMNQLQVGDLC